ncbi:hypothetical protein A8U91_04281 [Halomonas elongata]|uniref:Uncharacterized protein n=1 Tax=Halomonas elongata TaxID=2746 RepID=A0A1B8NZ04_HALEL|nr:hypothetical protein [Halomonas elongata]OBX35210.1 hypothetical protein A8U91_04281 [Halomonas elongata]
MKRVLPAWARSVRVRLLVIALLPMLVLLPLLLGMAVLRWSGKVDDLLTVKVNGDLTIAHQYMARLRENSGTASRPWARPSPLPREWLGRKPVRPRTFSSGVAVRWASISFT